MAMEFKLDIDEFVRDLRANANDVERGTRESMDQIKDDWIQKSRDVAPLDKGNLRQQIHGYTEGAGANSKVIVTGNATNSSRGYGRFNYGYYLHEEAPSSTNLSTLGTTLKFFDETALAREREWMRWLEEDIRQAARRRGF
jgi:hypothetical protein